MAKVRTRHLLRPETFTFTFTFTLTLTFTAGSLKTLKGELEKQLESYTSVDLSVQKGRRSDDEAHVLELKLKALVLDTIHNMDVVEQLLAAQCAAPSDWNWQRQLRFYTRRAEAAGAGGGSAGAPAEVAVGRMVDAECEYTYEYEGNAPKLVHTPLTDKCYLTLLLGMQMGLGGNPYGPAGTGKTESVKALGNLFGRQVLVFNCDEVRAKAARLTFVSRDVH